MVIGIHHRHRWHHRDWRPQIERTVKCPSTKAPATDSHQHTWAGNESNYSAEKASFRHLSAIVTAQSTASPLIHWTVSRSVFVSGSQLVGNVFSADRTHLHGFNFLSASLHFINFRVFFQFSSQIESSLRTRFITCASWHTTRKLLMSSTMYWLPFADNLSPWQMCFLSSLKPIMPYEQSHESTSRGTDESLRRNFSSLRLLISRAPSHEALNTTTDYTEQKTKFFFCPKAKLFPTSQQMKLCWRHEHMESEATSLARLCC